MRLKGKLTVCSWHLENSKNRTRKNTPSRLGWLKAYRSKLQALEMIEDPQEKLEAGVDLLAGLLAVAEDLYVLDYEIKIALGLKARPE